LLGFGKSQTGNLISDAISDASVYLQGAFTVIWEYEHVSAHEGTMARFELLSRQVTSRRATMRVEKEEARQAEKSGVVRYVLGASLAAVVIAMALIWFYYAT
jgi:hypothetical protein